MFGDGFVTVWANTKAHLDMQHRTFKRTLYLNIADTWAFRALNLPGGRAAK